MTIDPEFVLGDIDPRMYGSYVAQLGRAVYTGIYEPSHPTATQRGFRQDVMDVLREAGIPLWRYTGGGSSSYYRWEQGVGAIRQPALQLWSNEVESNEFGLNEFVQWVREMQASPYVCVNVGLRGVLDAGELVEYCNVPSGTAMSNLRVEHGFREPHAVKLWNLGNELDAPWELGGKTPAEYGRTCFEAAKVMKRIDPTIELVADGTSSPHLPHYPDWNREVLEQANGAVDYISPHIYLGKFGRSGSFTTAEFLAQSAVFDEYLTVAEGTCDYVQAKHRSRKRIDLCVDEWNVWYHTLEDVPVDSHVSGKPEDWVLGSGRGNGVRPSLDSPEPLNEDPYTLEDAIVVGLMLIVLLRHARRVRIACLSTAINVEGAVRTVPGGSVWRQATWYPFLHAATLGCGKALKVAIEGDGYEVEHCGHVNFVDGIATIDEENGEIVIFAVNRSLDSETLVSVVFHGTSVRLIEHLVLDGDSPGAKNTASDPTRVTPRRQDTEGITVVDGVMEVMLAPLSWNVIRLAQTLGRSRGVV